MSVGGFAPIKISYDLTMQATNFDSPIPDALFMRVLDTNLNPVNTLSSSGGDFLTQEFVAPYSIPAGPETYGWPGEVIFGQTVGGFTPGTVTRINSVAPEPGTLALVALPIIGFLLLPRLRTRQSIPAIAG